MELFTQLMDRSIQDIPMELTRESDEALQQHFETAYPGRWKFPRVYRRVIVERARRGIASAPMDIPLLTGGGLLSFPGRVFLVEINWGVDEAGHPLVIVGVREHDQVPHCEFFAVNEPAEGWPENLRGLADFLEHPPLPAPSQEEGQS